MIWIALAIVLCMVLYLIDKHQQWKKFSYVVLTVVVLTGIIGGIALYDAHSAKADEFQQYKVR